MTFFNNKKTEAPNDDLKQEIDRLLFIEIPEAAENLTRAIDEDQAKISRLLKIIAELEQERAEQKTNDAKNPSLSLTKNS